MLSDPFRDMIAKLLPADEQEAFFASLHSSLKKSISLVKSRTYPPNPLRSLQRSQGELNIYFGEKWRFSPSPFGKTFDSPVYVDRDDLTYPLGKTRQHLCGFFYIQEVAASLPANILASLLPELYAQTGQPLLILDTCAAPGGKSIQVADALLTQKIPGIVRGNDVDNKRMISRGSNIQRCSMYNTVGTVTDATRFGNLYPEMFDAILVDAPCSGEGTGFKSDAAYKRRKQESINKIVGLQGHILTAALKACKVGGTIIYSTCTLNPYENEGQIQKILTQYGDHIRIEHIEVDGASKGISEYDGEQIIDPAHAAKMIRCRPHRQQTGGFFVCRITKTKSFASDGDTTAFAKKKAKSSSSDRTTPLLYKPAFQREIAKLLFDNYAMTIDPSQHFFVGSSKHIYLAHPSIQPLLDAGIFLQHIGVPILKLTGKTYSLHHECGAVLGHLATKNRILLGLDELQDYVLGKDLLVDNHPPTVDPVSMQHLYAELSPICNNYVILLFQSLSLSVGKVVGNDIKNKFFKW